jgi:membrane protease YdiL (CAAX protease family)
MAVVGSLFFAETLGVIVLAVIGAAGGGGSFHASEAIRNNVLDARFQLPVQFLSYSLVVTFIFLTARVKYHRGFLDAIQWRSLGSQTWIYVPAGLALAIGSQLIPALFPPDRPLPIEKMFRDPLSGYLLMFFGIGVAPFVEEMFFRGMIYPVMERRWGIEAAVFFSALLFSSIHAQQLGGGIAPLAAIFLVGVALGYARGRTGSLVPGFIMHTSYNATLFAALIVSTKGFRQFPS